MKLFIDTANIDEIKDISKLGIIQGVTTNPSLIAKEGRDLKTVIKEISLLIDGPISAEVISLDFNSILQEARSLAKIHNNIVIKIPMCKEGIKAVNVLQKEGIKTNVTLVFTANQALIAAKAGASYVSPFIGRLDDIGANGLNTISDIKSIFDNYNINTEIIGASIRNTTHVKECAKIGCHIATIPYKILIQMFQHPLTDIGIKKFLEDYKKSNLCNN